MQFEHQPLHLIAIDEQRSVFFNEEVLDLQGALQIGFRGKHADVGGVSSYQNSFGWLSRNSVNMAAGMAGLHFSKDELANYPSIVNFTAKPSDNDKIIYNDGEKRSFPRDMYLGGGVTQFGWHTPPYNNIDGHNSIDRNVWVDWAK